MALLREYTVRITEHDDVFDIETTKTYTVESESMKITEEEFVFQTYVEEANSFRVDGVFERHPDRKFDITSKPL